MSQREECSFCRLRLFRWDDTYPSAVGNPESRKGPHVVEGECDQPTMEPPSLILKDALDQFAMMRTGASCSLSFYQERFVWRS